MDKNDILFCEEMSKFLKEEEHVKFPEFRNKLWELSEKYGLNPKDAFIIYMDNYDKFNS